MGETDRISESPDHVVCLVCRLGRELPLWEGSFDNGRDKPRFLEAFEPDHAGLRPEIVLNVFGDFLRMLLSCCCRSTRRHSGSPGLPRKWTRRVLREVLDGIALGHFPAKLFPVTGRMLAL